MSLTLPLAARRALEGTQPRFTQVPPTSRPEKTAVVRPWLRACRAAPWPPTPQPIMARSKSYSVAQRWVGRREVGRKEGEKEVQRGRRRADMIVDFMGKL